MEDLKLDNKENLGNDIVHDIKYFNTADKEHLTFFFFI